MRPEEWDQLEIDLACFYRVRIKRPPDSIAELAAHFGVTEAAVEAGIERVRATMARNLLRPTDEGSKQ